MAEVVEVKKYIEPRESEEDTVTREVSLAVHLPSERTMYLRTARGRGKFGERDVEYTNHEPSGAPLVYYRGRCAIIDLHQFIQTACMLIDEELDGAEE